MASFVRAALAVGLVVCVAGLVPSLGGTAVVTAPLESSLAIDAESKDSAPDRFSDGGCQDCLGALLHPRLPSIGAQHATRDQHDARWLKTVQALTFLPISGQSPPA